MQKISELVPILEAIERGEKWECWNYEEQKWELSIYTSVCDALYLASRKIKIRLAPKVKMRPIRVDELPHVFEIKFPNGSGVAYFRHEVSSVDYWIQNDFKWTTDGLTFRPFLVEEKCD